MFLFGDALGKQSVRLFTPCGPGSDVSTVDGSLWRYEPKFVAPRKKWFYNFVDLFVGQWWMKVRNLQKHDLCRLRLVFWNSVGQKHGNDSYVALVDWKMLFIAVNICLPQNVVMKIKEIHRIQALFLCMGKKKNHLFIILLNEQTSRFDLIFRFLNLQDCQFGSFFFLHLIRLIWLAGRRCCWERHCLKMIPLIKSTHLFVETWLACSSRRCNVLITVCLSQRKIETFKKIFWSFYVKCSVSSALFSKSTACVISHLSFNYLATYVTAVWPWAEKICKIKEHVQSDVWSSLPQSLLRFAVSW